jgi:universal stress protein A
MDNSLMPRYERILAVIDLSERGELVARRALRLARSCDARLAVAHVVDYTPGFESDHVPFLTPQQMQGRLVRVARGELGALLGRIGADHVEQRVASGRPRREIVNLVSSIRPDLIVVGPDAPDGLAGLRQLTVGKGPDAHSCDVFTVQVERKRAIERLHAFLAHA